MAEREGQQLSGYRLLKLLGEGDFAEVYLGEHKHLGTQAAIKLFYTRVVEEEEVIFRQEARTLAHLVHHNIVRVLDFNIESGTDVPYLVMDYAPGGSLRTRHPQGTRLPLFTITAYIQQVATALQYAHDQGVIHCDVKPANILLGRHGELLLSDFGIAKLLSDFDIIRLSQTEGTSEYSFSHAADTPYYMAPEQTLGQPERASDQYALAIMVYAWLCGQLPFSGGVKSNIQYQHAHEAVPSLHEQFPTISLAVEQVVLKALAKKPEKRFDSVHAFAVALEQASLDTATRPARLISSTPTITTSSTLRQNKTVTRRGISRRAVLFGAGGAVVLALAGTGIWWERRKTPLLLLSQPERISGLQPNGLQGTLYLTYRGHSGIVNAIAWSPDGKHIASGSFIYRGHSGLVFDVAWSPDGKRIASASQDRTVQVWDAANGGNAFIYRGHSDYVEAIAWSPDGRRIASASLDKTAQVWNVVNGGNAFIYHRHSDRVTAVAWSLDSQRIASGSFDGTVQVWQAV